MAFTSLRVSDLKRLKVVHIIENRIDMFAKKTGEHLTIPLTEEAKRIIEKCKGEATEEGLVFDIQSPQKLNDAVKDAAKAAGLDRIITERNAEKNQTNSATSFPTTMLGENIRIMISRYGNTA